MISTRRFVVAVVLAASVTGLAAPSVNAAGADTRGAGRLGPVALLDSPTVRDIPGADKEEDTGSVTQTTQQRRPHEPLRQVIGMVAPVTGLLPPAR